MVNRIWPTAVAGEADSVSSVSASACHIGGPNSVNPGQILLVYGNNYCVFTCRMEEVLQKLCVWCTHVQASGIIERGKTHK